MAPPDSTTLDALLAERSWLNALARRLARDAQRAEDAVQATWLAALERGPRDGAPRRSWLAAVLRNALRQERRARGRRDEHEGRARRSGCSPSAAEVAARVALQRRLAAAVEQLEEPFRTAIVLRFLDGRAPREIARRLGVPVKTVHSRIERGTQRLRARLDGEGGRREWLAALLPLLEASRAAAIGGGLVSTPFKVGWAVVGLAIGMLALRGAVTDRVPRGERAVEVAGSVGVGVTAPRAPLGRDDARERPAAVPAAGAPPSAAADSATLALRVARAGSEVPVEGAFVRVEAEGRDLGSATTDALGAAVLEVPAGLALELSVAPDRSREDPASPVGRGRARLAPLGRGERRQHAIALRHGLDGVYHGRVVAAEDGRPLGGATLALHERPPALGGSGAPDAYAETESDADGRFELRYASFRTTRVRVAAEGRGAALIELGHGHELPHHAFEVELAREAALTVALASLPEVEGELGVFLEADAAALAQPRGARMHGHGLRSSQRLDATRAARFERLPAGVELFAELRAGARLVWRAPRPIVLAPGEARRVEWDLDAGLRLLGRLVDEAGAPVPARELWLLPVSVKDPPEQRPALYFGPEHAGAIALRTRTDAAGAYELASVPPGRWWFGPAPVGDDVPACGTPLVVEPGELVRALELVRPRGLFVHGRVVDGSGRGLARRRVLGTALEAHGSVRTASDDAGRFALGPLMPWSHWLCADALDAAGPSEAVWASTGAEGVELVLGDAGTIAGTVVDAASGAPERAQVQLVMRGRGSHSVGTGESGAFRFVGNRPGTYHLRASTNDGRVAVSADLELAAGERRDDVELALAPGGSLRVTYEGPEPSLRLEVSVDGAPICDATVRLGDVRLEAVPSGRVRALVYGHDEAGQLLVRDERTVIVNPGELVDVSLSSER